MGMRSVCIIAGVVLCGIAATFALLPRTDLTRAETGKPDEETSEAMTETSGAAATTPAVAAKLPETTLRTPANTNITASTNTIAGADDAEDASHPGDASNPEDATAAAELERGLAFRKQGRYDTAITIFRRALATSPSDEWSGEFLFQVGQTQYEIATNKLDTGATLNVAEPFLHEALSTFAAVLEKYPATKRAPSASYMSGSTHLLLDQPETALTVYQATFDRFPSYPARSRALLRVGMALTVLDRIPEAVALFRRIVREFPERQRDVDLAKKYLHQLAIVGGKATPLYADAWLNNLVGGSGLASFQGEVVALVFMATWCSSCSEAIPHLRRVIERWSRDGVVFLAALDPTDPLNTEAIDVYVDRSELEFLDVALVKDPRAWAAYQTDRLPAMVVIDRRGVIRWRGHPELFPTVLVRKTLSE